MAQYRKDVFNLAKGPGQAIHDPRVQEDLAREASARADSQLRASIQNQLKQQSLATSAQQNQASQFAEEMAMRGAQMRQQQGQFDTGLEARGQESDAQRQFQQLMQQAGFDFQGEQAGLGREHQAGMQEAGFGFQEQQGDAQRQFQSLMQQAGFDFQRGESKLGRDQRASQFGASHGLQRQQAGAAERRFGTNMGLENRKLGQQREQFLLKFGASQEAARVRAGEVGHQRAMDILQKSGAMTRLSEGEGLTNSEVAQLMIGFKDPSTGKALAGILGDPAFRNVVTADARKELAKAKTANFYSWSGVTGQEEKAGRRMGEVLSSLNKVLSTGLTRQPKGGDAPRTGQAIIPQQGASKASILNFLQRVSNAPSGGAGTPNTSSYAPSGGAGAFSYAPPGGNGGSDWMTQAPAQGAVGYFDNPGGATAPQALSGMPQRAQDIYRLHHPDFDRGFTVHDDRKPGGGVGAGGSSFAEALNHLPPSLQEMAAKIRTGGMVGTEGGGVEQEFFGSPMFQKGGESMGSQARFGSPMFTLPQFGPQMMGPGSSPAFQEMLQKMFDTPGLLEYLLGGGS